MIENILQVLPIDKIRSHVNGSTCPLLERQPIASADVILETLKKHANCREVFVDVPLSAIVGMMRLDFWREGQSWRDILAGNDRGSGHLTAKGWEDFERIISYIEGNLEMFNFPAMHAGGPLKLHAVGGAAISETGNHRLVAAYCWLAAKFDQNAFLKRAFVAVYEIQPIVLETVRKLHAEGYKLQVFDEGVDNWRGFRLIASHSSLPCVSSKFIANKMQFGEWSSMERANTMIKSRRNLLTSELIEALVENAWCDGAKQIERD